MLNIRNARPDTTYTDAGAKLVAAGWTKSHSIMADKAGQESKCYGIVYVRHGFRFYLNKDTLDMVADACEPTPAMGE